MPKQQYLSHDEKGWKLRRRVPSKLKKLVGKTEWVERLAGADYREARERAKTFGVRTDAEIKRYESLLKQAPATQQKLTTDEPGFNFELTDNEIDQIAIAYFYELEKAIQERGGYRGGVNEENRSEVLIELAEELEEADAVQVGDHSRDFRYPDRNLETVLHPTALKQLIKYRFLSEADYVEIVQVRRKGKTKARKRLRVTSELQSNIYFQRLANKLAEANAEISRRKFEAVDQNRYPTLHNPTFKPAIEPGSVIAPDKEIRLGQLIDSYLAQRGKEVGTSRYSQLSTACDVLEEEIGRNTPLANITRAQCQAIADLFVTIPRHAKSHYKGLSRRKASEAYAKKNGAPVQRHNEASKNLAVLREIFEFAVDKEWMANNPAQRVKIVKPARPTSYADQEEGYEPFSIKELDIIFHQPLYTGCKDDGHGINSPGNNHPRRSRFWVPLISAFSGLRLQEILQLERSDIRAEGCIHYFDINDKIVGTDYREGEYTKRLKTRNSLRRVPVHPELMKIGFLDFVENSKREWLFPDIPKGDASKMSDQFSKKFRTFMKPTGLSVPRRKVFHSFRNSFNDALRKANVRVEYREPIMGWVDYKRMDNLYGSGHLIKKLHDELARASYDGLDLSHLYPSNTQ